MVTRDRLNGFTIVETLIALALASIVIAGIFQLFINSQKTFGIQDQVVEMQQNNRTGIYFITKELRSAGYDPEFEGIFGFVTDFDAPNEIFPDVYGNGDINYATESTRVAFTMDNDGDKKIDINDNEIIAYQYIPADNTIRRYSIERNNWDIIATGIEAFDLVFLDSNGNVTTNPNDFHAVQVAIVSRTKKTDLDYTNATSFLNKQGKDICPSCSTDKRYRRRMLTTTIRLRNSRDA
jgi:type II secretory pathway pseudopilin PulG